MSLDALDGGVALVLALAGLLLLLHLGNLHTHIYMFILIYI